MNFKLAEMQQRKAKWTLNVLQLTKLSFFLFFLLVTAISSFAQTKKTVTGKVINEAGAPLVGVSVIVKNSSKGTTTDVNGTFKIEVTEGTALVISSTGYTAQEITVGQESDYSISLKPSAATGLDEVVVVGYGTQKRSSLTGAISTVTAKSLTELPVPSIDQALQGRVTGLAIINNGSPGSAPIVQIRGISSISFGSEPLYVIDGFPTGSLNTFDSRDVQSVEVLKDASAAAIYGSRATNGVIMITTKKGKRNGRFQVNLDSYVGFQSPAKKIDLLNTQQYVEYAKRLLGSTAPPPRLLDSNFNKPIYAGATQTFAQTNTDWQDEYFKRNSIITQHNISMSGGTEISRFYVSSGYFKQEGINQGLGYERGNFRINSEHQVGNAFTFGENLYLAISDQQFEGTGGNRSPLANVIRMQPYLPVRNPNNKGGFMGPISSFDASDPTNPVEPAILHEYHNKQLKILGTAFGEVKLTNWLKFRSTAGIDYSNNLTSSYVPIYNDGGTLESSLASIGRNRNLFTTTLFTQQLSFDKNIGKHNIGATVVYEYQGQKFTGESVSGNQGNNDVKTLTGASNLGSNYAIGETNIESYVGRVTYNYFSKYFFNASIRRDGLSVWAPGKKYRSFPSASVAWRIDQEQFLQDVKSISELKLRAGYGGTGINGAVLGSYPWQVGIAQNASLYPFGGTSPNTGPGSFYDKLGNKELEWEYTTQTNIGLDLGLFNNKLAFVAEFYKRQTDNLILDVPTAPSQGFNGGGVLANVGAMVNRGFEFQATYTKSKGNFRWNASGLISIVRNKVLKLNTESATIFAGRDADFGGGDITRTSIGEPIAHFYGYVTDGLFQNADELASHAKQAAGTAVGDIRFKDLNKDNKIDDKDRTILGTSVPKFTYSVNYNANYQSFDLSIFLQGSQGNKVYNGTRVLTEGMLRLFNAGTEVLNAWTPAKPNTTMPRIINSDPNGNARVSDRWIEDASYMRVKNIMLGYTLPASLLNSLTKNKISSFRLYISSQNLITITQYKGWDPEIGNRRGGLTNGIDYGQYPSARSFQIGLQAGF